MLKRLSKNRLLIVAGFALLLGGFTLGSYAQQKRGQTSKTNFASVQAAVVKLGVYDKNLVLGEPRSYNALFVVTGEDGKQYRSQRHATVQDNWVYTEFPYDFDDFPVRSNVTSTYRWKCVVEGMAVASGQFQWGGNRALAVQ